MTSEQNNNPSQDFLETNNNIDEVKDTFDKMLDFFVANKIEGFDQEEYDYFTQEQQDYIESSFNQLKQSPEKYKIAIEAAGGLPYDDDSYEEFKEAIDKLIITLNLVDSEWLNNNTEIGDSIDEIDNKTEETDDLIDESKIELKLFGESIKDTYGSTLIDGVSVNELYETLLNENSDKEDFNVHLEFAKEYGAKLLEHIAKNGTVEEFTAFKTNLEKVQTDFGIIIQGFDAIKTWEDYRLDISFENLNTIPAQKNAIKYGLDTSEFRVSRMEGDVLIYGDQKIDFGVKPPVKFITSGKFELQSATLDFKVDKQTRKNIFILEKTIPKTQEKISSIRDKITSADSFMEEINGQQNFTEQKLDYLFKQYSQENNNPLKQQILSAIETYDTKPDYEALKTLLQSDTDKKKVELNTQIAQTEELLANQESTLARLKLKLSIQTDTFKKSVIEQDEKTREVLDFITSIGFDIIPQNISSFIFNLISETNPVQIGDNIITGIDLQTFTLTGTFSPTLGEGGVSDLNTKKVFMKLMNKMITGDEEIPINIDSYFGGTPQYRKSVEDGEVMGNDKLASFIRVKIDLDSGNPYSKIQENIGIIGKKSKNNE